MTMRKFLLLLPLSALAFASTVNAQTVEQRLQRVERMLDSRSMLEMLDRIEALQQEVQQLRGLVEEQQHELEGLKGRQRELYLDVDRRMSRLEREGRASMPTDHAQGDMPALTSSTAPQAAAPSQGDVPAAGAEGPGEGDTTEQLKQERAAYQKAFDLLRELRYEQATKEFRSFLKQYPNGRYAHIAQYWLGEAAYARRDFAQAIKEYQALLDNHPKSAKRAEAMLKIGYSYQEMNKPAEAKRMMERLIELYPDSTEAAQARNQLVRLKKSGG